MTTKSSFFVKITVLFALLITLSTARAQTNFWWTNNTGGVWSGANWTNSLGSGGPILGGSNDYAITFQNTSTISSTNNDALVSGGTTNFFLNLLTFANASVTLFGGAGTNLVFTNNTSGVLPQVLQNTGNAMIFNIGLSLATNTTFAGTGGGAITVNNAITGSGQLIMSGGYQLSLYGTNSFSGGLVVNGANNGYLYVTNDLALGATTGGITLSGGQMQNGPANVTINSNRLTTLSGIGYFRPGSGDKITFAGKITGAGAFGIVWDSGTVNLATNINDYTGDTIIGTNGTTYYSNTGANPTLQLGVDNALPFGAGKGNVVFAAQNANTNSATLDLNGHNAQINGLNSFNPKAVVDTKAAGAITLTVGNGDANGSFGGIIQNTTGTLSLVKTGLGSQILRSNDTYNGSTTISNGSLIIASALAVQNSTVIPVANQSLGFSNLTAATIGGLAGAGNVDLTNVAGVAVNLSVGNNTSNTTYSGTLSDYSLGGTLTKVGAGTTILTGSNAYTFTTISAGILQIGSNTASGTLGTSNVVNNAALTFLRSDNFTVSNNLSGSGSVNINNGTISLAGSNTFAGTLYVNNGANLIFNGNTNYSTVASGGRSINVTTNGTMIVTNNATVILNGTLSLGALASTSSGNLNLSSGLLVINGNEGSNTNYRALQIGEYPGGSSTFNMSGGSLFVTNGNVYLPWNATNSFWNMTGGNATVGGIIFGQAANEPGTLNLYGGTLSLGTTGMMAGAAANTVNLGGGTVTAYTNWSSTVAVNITNVNGSPTFSVPAGLTINLASNVTGTGGFTKLGTGTLTLGGVINYAGPTIISNGVLTLAPVGITNVLNGVISGSGSISPNRPRHHRPHRPQHLHWRRPTSPAANSASASTPTSAATPRPSPSTVACSKSTAPPSTILIATPSTGPRSAPASTSPVRSMPSSFQHQHRRRHAE